MDGFTPLETEPPGPTIKTSDSIVKHSPPGRENSIHFVTQLEPFPGKVQAVIFEINHPDILGVDLQAVLEPCFPAVQIGDRAVDNAPVYHESNKIGLPTRLSFFFFFIGSREFGTAEVNTFDFGFMNAAANSKFKHPPPAAEIYNIHVKPLTVS